MMKALFVSFSFFLSVGICFPANLLAEEIIVGTLFDISGVTSSLGKDYKRGCDAAVKYFNDNGGVNGKRVKLLESDTAYNEKAIRSYYKKYKKKGIFALLGWGSKDTHILKENVQKDKIVYMSSSYDGLHTNPKIAPFSFFVGSSYSDQIRAAMQFAKNNGAKKVVFTYPATVFGEIPIPAGKDFAKSIGLEIGPDVKLKWRDKNIWNKLKKMEEFNPDFAWVGSVTDQFAAILKEAGRLKLQTRFIVNCWGIDESLPKRVDKKIQPLAYGVMPIAPFSEKVAGIEPIRKMVKGKDENMHTVHLVKGWLSSMVLCEGLKLADSAGELNGPGLRKALESIKDYNTGGITPENISYSDLDHRPITSSYIYGIDSNKLSKVDTIHIERKKEYLGW
jgi:branched-chain amino acid transport system substrate-binding protein